MSITIVSDKLPGGISKDVTPPISSLGKQTLALHIEFREKSKAKLDQKRLEKLMGVPVDDADSQLSIDSVEKDLIQQLEALDRDFK